MSLLIGATSALQGASGQGAAADLGAPIDQSLRFTSSGSSQKLQSNSSLATDHTAATLSYWIKFSNVDSTALLGLVSCAGGVNVVNSFDGRTTRPRFFNGGGHSTGFYVDPSAWYHIICIYGRKAAGAGTVSHETFINGELILDNTTSSVSAQSDNFRIGEVPGHGTGFQGYIAEFNYLDGTAIGLTADGNPDEFGRYNDDGVWVPKSVSSLTSDQYGAKGFRLTFASDQHATASTAIGIDSAPTGGNHASANNFTATGFDTGDVASFAGTIFTDHVNTGASATPNTSSTASTFTNSFTNAFDGSTSTRIHTNGAGSWIIFRPSTAIAMSTGLRIWAEGAFVNQVWLNGSNSSFTSTGTTTWQTIPIGSETQITSIAIQGTPSPAAGATLFAIEVDGTILTHNIDNDVDYNDTPTSNYSTLSGVGPQVAGGTTYSNALADANLAVSGVVFKTNANGFDSGRYYWEVHVGQVVTNTFVGIYSEPNGDRNQAVIVGSGNNNTNVAGGTFNRTDTGFAADDVWGIDCDFDNGNITWFRNGSSAATLTGATLNDKYWFPGSNSNSSISSGTPLKYNFGQMPFIHAQPANTTTMQTNNLSEPTIKNGKEYFDVVTWSGDDASPRTLTGLEFEPDLVWTKRRNSTASHLLYDSLRGFGVDKHLHTDVNAVEGSLAELNTDVGGFVSNNASNGFVTTAGTTNSIAVNGSGNTYTAWCWKCDGSFTPTVTGVSSASGKRNTTAGFSILTYTGNNSSGTITHGLDSAPEFILFKRRSVADNWLVYHVGTGATKSLTLDDNSAEATSTFLSNTTPTGPTGSPASTITLGGVSGANGTGTFVAYCWHSVEGFSKFGSYTGNGDTSGDGPFVYTGFAIGWLLIKSSATGSWRIHDATRSPNNENKTTLLADTADAENVDSSGVDLLSNGFKAIWSNSEINGSGVEYYYAAFALNPFGGENAPPATAR